MLNRLGFVIPVMALICALMLAVPGSVRGDLLKSLKDAAISATGTQQTNQQSGIGIGIQRPWDSLS